MSDPTADISGIGIFRIDKIRPGNTALIIGRRNTGKTTTVLDILWHNRDIPLGLIVDGEGEYSRYKQVIPSQFRHEEYTEDIPRAVAKRQKAIVRKRDTGTDTRGFCVMDDCLYDPSWTRNKYIRYMLKERQNLDLLFIVSGLYVFGLSQQIVSTFDYVFLSIERYTPSIKRLHALYAATFMTYDTFAALMYRIDPSDTTMIVIDNTSSSCRIEDRIFFYTPTPRPDFLLCERYAQPVKEDSSS